MNGYVVGKFPLPPLLLSITLRINRRSSSSLSFGDGNGSLNGVNTTSRSSSFPSSFPPTTGIVKSLSLTPYGPFSPPPFPFSPSSYSSPVSLSPRQSFFYGEPRLSISPMSCLLQRCPGRRFATHRLTHRIRRNRQYRASWATSRMDRRRPGSVWIWILRYRQALHPHIPLSPLPYRPPLPHFARTSSLDAIVGQYPPPYVPSSILENIMCGTFHGGFSWSGCSSDSSMNMLDMTWFENRNPFGSFNRMHPYIPSTAPASLCPSFKSNANSKPRCIASM